MAKLSPKQEAFVASYVANPGDLRSAAQEAGISYTYARKLASGVVKPEVKAAIEEELSRVQESAREDARTSREDLILRLDEVATKALRDEKYGASARALREIGLLQGYYTQKVEHTGKMSVVDLIASLDPREFDE